MTAAAPSMIENISVSYEAAYEAVSEMTVKIREDLNGVTVYSGYHPEHGNIHVVIPAMGDGLLLLPFAFHDFSA